MHRPYLLLIILKQDLDEEVEWFESYLSLLINKYAKILYIQLFLQMIVE